MRRPTFYRIKVKILSMAAETGCSALSYSERISVKALRSCAAQAVAGLRRLPGEKTQAANHKCLISSPFASLKRVTLGASATKRGLLSADAPEPLWFASRREITYHVPVTCTCYGN